MNTVRLQDGRNLAYEEYGDPNGAPLFFFHGFPNSRLGARLSHESAARHHVRVVSLDRPGYGRSDFKKGRMIGDWPDDVAQAADALGIDRFSVLGYSGGGPYAAACAAKLPDRIASAGIVAGVGPLTEREAAKGFKLSTRIGMWFWRTFPFLITLAFMMFAFFVRRGVQRVVVNMARALPDVDRKILERPEVWAAMREDLQEAFRQGSRGAAHDMKLYLRRWDVDPMTIPNEVFIWHGDVDETVPISNGRYMAKVIPNARATFYPGEGHLLIVDRIDEFQRSLFPGR